MALRTQVLAEEFKCYLCPGGGTPDDLVDHVVPLSAGGTDDRSNLRRICRACHNRKTAAESARARGGGSQNL
jgi:5-methylcytosine-specific restriction protein A